ncbi:hypothetical protein V8C86DRAFT_2489305 [Haematococcus lacustris]
MCPELEALEKLQTVSKLLKKRWTLLPASPGQVQRQKISMVVYCGYSPPPSPRGQQATPFYTTHDFSCKLELQNAHGGPPLKPLLRCNALYDSQNSPCPLSLSGPLQLERSITNQPRSGNMVWQDNAAVWPPNPRAALLDIVSPLSSWSGALTHSPMRTIRSAEADAAAFAVASLAATACRHVVEAALAAEAAAATETVASLAATACRHAVEAAWAAEAAAAFETVANLVDATFQRVMAAAVATEAEAATFSRAVAVLVSRPHVIIVQAPAHSSPCCLTMQAVMASIAEHGVVGSAARLAVSATGVLLSKSLASMMQLVVPR